MGIFTISWYVVIASGLKRRGRGLLMRVYVFLGSPSIELLRQPIPIWVTGGWWLP
jgi:hypothetical protein